MDAKRGIVTAKSKGKPKNKVDELESYSTFVRPYDLSLITEKTSRCNGITRDVVSSAPPFADIANKVYDLLHGFFPINSPIIGFFIELSLHSIVAGWPSWLDSIAGEALSDMNGSSIKICFELAENSFFPPLSYIYRRC